MTDGPTLRLDKWLWQARFFKSRSVAATFIKSGKLRLNDTATSKAHQLVRPGDVLTFPAGPYVRVIEIKALGTRRGPAPEAQGLYHDLHPIEDQPRPDKSSKDESRPRGMGRPTKADRRAIDKLKGRD